MFNRQIWLFFLFLGFLAACLISENWYGRSDKKYIAAIEANLQTELEKIQAEADEIVSSRPQSLTSFKYAHFLFSGTEVIAWTNNEFVPDVRMLADSSEQYWQTPRGDFIVLRKNINAIERLVSLLPLYTQYPITNRYLTPELNRAVFENYSARIFPEDAPVGDPVTIGNKVFLKVVLAEQEERNQPLSLFFGLMAFALLLVLVLNVSVSLYRHKKLASVFFLITGFFITVRVLMVEWSIPTRWWPSRIFSPQEFASSTYNASIGDLVLNASGILVICTYVFFTYHKWHGVKHVLNLQNKVSGWFVSVVCLLAALFSFLYPFLFVETIFHNSVISLDITHTLSLNWLRVLAFLSLLFGVASGFFFVHVFVRLSRQVARTTVRFVLALAAALLLFILYFQLEGRDYWITVVTALPFMLILQVSKLGLARKGTFVSFLYLFVVLIVFGIQHAWSIKHFSEEEKVESQFRFATSYLIDRDVMAEYLLNESRKRIKNDAFIQSRITSPFLNKATARQKIRQVYLSSYFDRYDIEIHLFNQAHEPLDELSVNRWEQWNKQLALTQHATEYEGIYFIRTATVEAGKRYLVTIPIFRMLQQVGYVVLDLSLKRTIPQSVYPELLVDSRFAEFFENRDKSFAFITDNHIQSNFGNYNYERDFDFALLKKPNLYKQGIRDDGFIHTAVEDDSGRVAVVSSHVYPFFFLFTNFSLFFVLCVFVLAVVVLVYGVRSWLKGKQINYASRIQLYIYLAFAVPLAIVAVTTLNRVSRSAETQLTQEYLSKSRLLGENLLPALIDYNSSEENRRELEEQLAAAARFSNVDVSVFDNHGKMIASTQPAITEGIVTSGLINRFAWERITLRDDAAFVLNDQIGQLHFNNAFFALKSPESASLLGVISLPFFESAKSLDATQITVLANILTVFTIIFMVFSMLSFYIVQSLTFPLRFITRTLSSTTLTGNKPLEWQSNDEIGLMVTEYNKMVENLEQSKIELSRSQKESAWREIARQVAHEIKNPLTPMKLTLQQMQIWLAKDALEKERAKQAVVTLLHQVEILNEIASSFSAFARMPAPILERLDVVALVTKTVNLYSSYEGGRVTLKYNGPALYINGDPQLLDRIFANLILNGLQAGEDSYTEVEVSIQELKDTVLIVIKDNGRGIPAELQEKIFVPYFTTKESGSGLGLAIARQGIELSGGKIWFESEPGSTFFSVAFPKL